jgi:hypothetical protein
MGTSIGAIENSDEDGDMAISRLVAGAFLVVASLVGYARADCARRA